MRAVVRGLVAVLLLGAASNAVAASPVNERGERSLAKILAGRAVGQPIDCIDPARAYSSEIIDGTAVVYRMPGGKIYVNRPRAGAANLDQDSLFHVRTFGARLCNRDTVTMIGRGGKLGPLPTGYVALGQFVPYGKVER